MPWRPQGFRDQATCCPICPDNTRTLSSVSKGKAEQTRDKCCTSFELNERDWDRFMERIARPATVPKGLRSLFSKPSVFE
jgi:hypothetical protein